jgi:predicted ATPase/class 3 adenylate cyclase
MGADPPTGTVTLLFTDIEGSTALLDRLGCAYGDVLATHHHLVRTEIGRHDGYEVNTAGDSFFAAFASAPAAIACARTVQRALRAQPWGEGVTVRVRMGLHTGTPEWRDGSYVGMDVHRAARIMAAAHGGQVLLSASTAALADQTALVDLGEHRLKDIPAPERLLQDGDERFAPVQAPGAWRLPVPATALVGRDAELAAAVAALRGGTRLLTLTGPGGTGKTRLALAIAAEAAGDFADGAVFADLAPVREPSGVAAALAAALPGRPWEGDPVVALAAQCESRSLLVLTDNFEHVTEAAPLVSGLLAAAPDVAVLATSRTPLRVRGEVEHPVDPLPADAAAALFGARARDVGVAVGEDDEAAVAEVCRLLDGLPLALELAAARARLFGVRGLAERLGHRLDVLVGGPRDGPERQRTLRDTIEWSHRLLGPGPRRTFRRMAVFAGGAELEAVEAVGGAVDDVEVLLDAALARRADGPRVILLETLREYAAERLAADDDSAEVAGRHAAHYLGIAREMVAAIFDARQPAMRRRLCADIGNLRAAHDHLLATDPDAALEVSGAFMEIVGSLEENRRRITQSLLASLGGSRARGRALVVAGRLAELSGDHAAALAHLREAAGLLSQTDDVQWYAVALSLTGTSEAMLGAVARGEAHLAEALDFARASGDDWAIAMALNNLADRRRDQPEVARRMYEESLLHRRRSGERGGVVVTTGNLAELELECGRLRESHELARTARRDALELEDRALAAWATGTLATAALLLGDLDGARARVEDATVLHADEGDPRTTATLALVAGALAARSDPRAAAGAWGAGEAVLERLGMEPTLVASRLRLQAEPAVRRALGAAGLREALAAGREAAPIEAVRHALTA